MSDPVLRNLLITQRYHEFAVQLRDAGAGEDATWCAFAVWASKTAGATIRGEVLPAKAKQLITADGAAAGGAAKVQPRRDRLGLEAPHPRPRRRRWSRTSRVMSPSRSPTATSWCSRSSPRSSLR